MKLIGDIYKAIGSMLGFFRQQNATLAMLNGLYIKQSSPNELVVAGTDTTLTIKPFGSLYQITRTDFVANEPELEQTWLAAYGYANMQLTDISFVRYFIFDAVSQSLYLATFTDQGDTIIELFIKNL